MYAHGGNSSRDLLWWGTGNPEKLFRMVFVVTEVQGTRITALDEQGNEATFTLKTPDMVVTMD